MLMKEITLIAGTEETRKTLLEQLRSYIGEYIRIKSYAIDEGIEEIIKSDLIILSSDLVYPEALPYLHEDSKQRVMTARRTINYHYIDKLLFIPPGSEVLFVNDVAETVFDSIGKLKELGINHLKFIPYYPGIKSVKPVKIAVTPGEGDKAPEFVEEIIDIGPRLIDMTSMTEILKRLDMLEGKAHELSQKYLAKIIQLGQRLVEATQETNRFNKNLKTVLEGVNDGLLSVDTYGEIKVANGNLEKIFQTAMPFTMGKNIRQIIKNKELLHFLLNDPDGANMILSIDNVEILVKKFYIKEENLIVATFKNIKEALEIERQLRRELIKRGHIGKYTFEDIVGSSESIKNKKRIAAKLASSELNILIEGESGTGKELFASAIHNCSVRRGGPFLGVNFSALPEDLVESELFGYEEGAFTGARKGGKKGLFEQANGGTLFLDEIGDISPKIQARLLRVLQEKEIMRVGGTEIIPVDVRVIAATNKNLMEMIETGKFRQDLYHRLKVLYVQLPPLRERKEDIRELVNYFIQQNEPRSMRIEEEVIQRLMHYNWYGNVRELKNTLEYMLAVCEGDVIRIHDIPEKSFFQVKLTAESFQGYKETNELEELGNSSELYFILRQLYTAGSQNILLGRKQLAELAKAEGYTLTEPQIRQRMNLLEEHGYLIKSKGRAGTRLTRKGKQMVEQERLNG
ncbi:Transcriptional regulator containing PAS, AAA-type ATPase, and DNA-binding Fis domains [Geosporobacter subterraneus DSM 17957]|uniref:Transcriptional regulator containing PAS, AAA-type ATPase, and DNA-binding Fis domains n=1 Tax=Geosporobacter subterraneus DSM 17957 TaxID=1121919 RepID=A0A1M6NRD2_9FIRM|nr:sigma 54-interacting transcriptional regulator [Geosporobacter subterraneus]SHJ98301.1 Transcriptional regulator containing PAS, AAA-type ATPase, and DNA-binding Fis domains [Geosporobacter subterraneus DSM 17957]